MTPTPHSAVSTPDPDRAAEPRVMKTLRLRVKDKHAPLLLKMARDVNQVWNFANETSARAIRDKRKWLSGYDLQKLTTGYSLCDGVSIGADSANVTCSEYAKRRDQFRRSRLNWRVSNKASPKYSLGWIPFRAVNVRYKAGQIKLAGHLFSLWDSYGLDKYELRAGSFSEDSRGRWYFNVAVEVAAVRSEGVSAIGIDLGLKAAATTSDGQVHVGRAYRALEDKLGRAQRAGKKRQARTISAKIKNQRKDGLHKFSTKLVKENAAIFVGDVSSQKLLKTRMAKSTQDAGWTMLKTMLEYKCHQAGVIFKVVDEAYSTQTCSECGLLGGPAGLKGLGIRRWRCSCGVEHDRDVNAARNIARAGMRTLAEGACANRARSIQPTAKGAP